METAKQAADGGGDNDLRRLHRQFQALKASSINIDLKERFMEGLHDIQLDVKEQEDINKKHEQQQENDADALRSLKKQNDERRDQIKSTISHICQFYEQVDTTTTATRAQLDATQQALEQHAATIPPPDSPLEPGPDQDECDELLHRATVRAKQLAAETAATEVSLSDLEASIRAGQQDMVAMRAQVAHLEAVQDARDRAAHADDHLNDLIGWCGDMLQNNSMLSGISIQDISNDVVHLQLQCRVPTTKPASAESGVFYL
eukprot:jgi/Chrzof1/14054/Cz08g22220.t1